MGPFCEKSFGLSHARMKLPLVSKIIMAGNARLDTQTCCLLSTMMAGLPAHVPSDSGFCGQAGSSS